MRKLFIDMLENPDEKPRWKDYCIQFLSLCLESSSNPELIKEKLHEYSAKSNLDAAESSYQVELARHESSLEQVEQSKGVLKRSKDDLSKTTIYALMFIIGLSCGSHPLCFSLSKENNLLRYSGTATALTNGMVMMGGLFNGVVGKLLDWHFDGKIIDNVRVYTVSDYKFALSIIPICFGLAIVISFFILPLKY